MKDVFAFIGVLAFICAFILLMVFLIQVINEFIDDKKYEYRRKHRFDNPPTAKCYCVDCKYWRKDDGRCSQFEGYYTADCWFCWKAEPMNRKEYDHRESE